MRKLLVAPLVTIFLTGCATAAAPLVMTIGGGAMTGYSLYNLGTVKGAKYKVEESDISATSRAELRSAKTLAVYPDIESLSSGDVVDIFNKRSGLNTISSRQTISQVKTQGLTRLELKSYPSSERAAQLVKFGRAVGAENVLIAEVAGTKTSNALGVFVGKIDAVLVLNCKVYSVKSGNLLLDENHKLIYDGKSTPTEQDLNNVAAMGMADRLYELRTGEKRDKAS